MSGATWYRLRSELRRSWRGLVALALLAGLAGGIVLGSVAGARRTASAVERLLAAFPPATGGLEGDRRSVAKAIELPQVSEAREGAYVLAGPVRNGEPIGIGSISLLAMDGTPPVPFVLAGRLPDPESADEAMVDEHAARLLGVAPGDRVDLGGFSWQQVDALFGGSDLNPSVPLPSVEVTGVVRTVIDLAERDTGVDVVYLGSGQLVVTGAWLDRYGERVAHFRGYEVRLANGEADVDAFRAGLREIDPQLEFFPGNDDIAAAERARRATEVQAFALAMFAVLAGTTFVLLVGQAVARQTRIAASEHPTLRAIGAPGALLLAVPFLRALLIGVLAACVAAGIAIAVSPLAPIGLARRAELAPGIAVDAPVLMIGVLAIVCVVLIAAAIPAFRGARAASRGARGSRPSWLAERLARAGFPVPGVVGVRLAYEPGRGATAVPVRATIGAATVAIAALLAAAVFGLNLQRLIDEPARQGWTWDLVLGNPHSQDLRDRVLPLLRDDEAVTAVTQVALSEVTLDGLPMSIVGITADGAALPPVLEGRLPDGDGEVALGGRTLRELGLGIGDRLQARGQTGKRVTLRVTGRVLLSPQIANAQIQLGEGALVTLEAMQRIEPQVEVNLFLVRLDPEGADATRAQLETRLQGMVLPPIAPDEVADVRAVSGLPLVLAALLLALAIGTVAHALVTSVRRRRRDLAILKTLGCVRAQVRGVVTWQSTAIAFTALAIAVPAGLAIGRWGWRTYATRLGIPADPSSPLLLAAALTIGILLLANLTAILPARTAARTSPAHVLRSE